MDRVFKREEHIYKSDAFEEIIKDTIRFFNGTPVLSLPIQDKFHGTEVYAIYYIGESEHYKEISKKNRVEFALRIEKITPQLKKTIGKLKKRYGFFAPEFKPWVTVREALSGLPDPSEIKDIKDHVYRAGAKSYPGHTGSYIDELSKTIKAGDHGVPGGENMIRFEDESVRYFTILEAKRIQTFPDNYIISGSWSEGMRQLGNAVPVDLGKKIGNELYGKLSCRQCV